MDHEAKCATRAAHRPNRMTNRGRQERRASVRPSARCSLRTSGCAPEAADRRPCRRSTTPVTSGPSPRRGEELVVEVAVGRLWRASGATTRARVRVTRTTARCRPVSVFAHAQACRLVPRPAPHRHRPLGRRLRPVQPRCGAPPPANTSTTSAFPGTESQRAYDLLKERFPQQSGDTASVVFAVDQGQRPGRRATARRSSGCARRSRSRPRCSRSAIRSRGARPSPRTARSPSPRSSSARAPATSIRRRSRRWPRTRSRSTARAESRSRSAATSSTGRRPSRAAPGRSSASSWRRSCCS